jgi:type I restriction enzyme, S subunit
MKNWDVKKLRDLADIRVSNVDKKIYPSERPVKLCNYMDVYTNEYINGSIQFMEGSANDAEIERFGLNIGDVIITKDSETPDDIGIPTVIHEQIDNLVCGYHLALIRPDNEKLDSIFLSKYLSTSRVANYFALHASGSTRFGLPIGAIESVEILTPPKKEQEKIAEVLSTIDRAIAQTEVIIAKQQRIKTGLMQDLLTKGIDENGNIRSEATHEFKDSAIGRIPVEWDVLTLDKVADILDPNPSHRNPIYIEYGYPFISTVEFIEPNKIEINTPRRVSESTVLEQEKRCFFSPNSIAFSRKGTIGKTRILPSGIRFALLDSLCVINAKKGTNSHFIYQMLRSYLLKQQIDSATMGVALPQMSIGRVRTLLIPVPNNEQEQSTIVDQISLISMREIQLWNELTKINLVKTGLMQDLLTGKVRVTNLLNQKAAAN